MKKIILLLLILQIGVINCSKAQVDPHFSQFYANPLWLNPALTGVFDGDTRLGANVRDQWAGVGNGYQTDALSADFKPTDKVGLGINLLNQAAGTAGYNYFSFYGTFGYGIAISSDGKKKLHFGIQAGFINRSFDPNKSQEDNQYNPETGFDPNLPNFENFTNTNATVFDAGSGIFYYDSDPTSTANLFGGVSVFHLNGANDPFATDGVKSKLPIRFDIHGGIKIKASDLVDITPNFIYIRQQQNQITAIDIYSELKFRDDYGLILGAMVRLNDAVVADVGYHLKNMVIGFSYDINTSPLNVATERQGGPELSISYIFSKNPKSPVEVCPRF